MPFLCIVLSTKAGMKGVCALLLVALLNSAVRGATVVFKYSPDLNGTFEWNDGNIWNTGTPPQTGDDVVIIGSNVSYHFSPLKIIDMGTVPINLNSFYFNAYDIQMFLGTSFTVANITEFGTADITGYGNASMVVTEYAHFVITSPFRTITVLSNGPVIFLPNIDLNCYGGFFEYVVLQGGTVRGSPLIQNGVLDAPDDTNLTIVNSAVDIYGTFVLESSNIQFVAGANLQVNNNATLIVQKDLYDAELQTPWGIVNNPGGTVIFNANQGSTKQIGAYISNWADMYINTTITDPSQPKGVTLDFTAPLSQLFNGTLHLIVYSESDFDKILYFPRDLPAGLAPPCTFSGFLDYKFEYTPSPNTLIPVISSFPGCASAFNLTTSGLSSDLTAQLVYNFPSEDGSNSVVHKLRVCSATDPDCSGSSTCSASVAAVTRGNSWTDQNGSLNQVYDIHVTNTGQRDVTAVSVALELAASPAVLWNLDNTSGDVYTVPFWNELRPNATVSYSGLVAVGGISVTLASVTCA